MTEDERQTAKEAGREGAREVLKTLGIDAENPREAQEDFIFLRQWRRGSNSIKSKILASAILTVFSAGLFAAWVGIKHLVK